MHKKRTPVNTWKPFQESPVVRPAIVPRQRGPETTPHQAATMSPTLPLESSRLRIRPLRRQDLDERQRWTPFNDPLHLIWDMPACSQRENDNWFNLMTDRRRRLTYGVEDLNGRLVGMISLRDISWGRSARLGIALSSDHVGQGYGTECLQLLLPYFFLSLKFRKMVLDVAAANLRAVRCYRRLGFQRTGSHWHAVDGPLDPQLFESPVHAALRRFFRWRWGRAEALYYDMELRQEEWGQT